MESWKPGCLRDGAVIVGQEPEIMDGSSKGAASESSQIICHRIVAVQRQASPLQRGSEVTVASVFGHKPGCRGCLLVAGTSLVRRDAHLMLLLLTIELGGVEDERGPIYLRRGRAVTSLVVYYEPCRWWTELWAFVFGRSEKSVPLPWGPRARPWIIIES